MDSLRGGHPIGVPCWMGFPTRFANLVSRGFDSSGLVFLGSDRIGSDRIGSDRIGSDRIGSDRIGSDRIGSDRIGSDRIGSDRIGWDSKKKSDRIGKTTCVDFEEYQPDRLRREGWVRRTECPDSTGHGRLFVVPGVGPSGFNDVPVWLGPPPDGLMPTPWMTPGPCQR